MYLSDSSVGRQDGEMSTVPISTNPAGVDDKKNRTDGSGGGPDGGDRLARTAAPSMVTPNRRCH